MAKQRRVDFSDPHDVEIFVVNECVSHLRELEARAQKRVVWYLVQQFGCELGSDADQFPEVAPQRSMDRALVDKTDAFENR